MRIWFPVAVILLCGVTESSTAQQAAAAAEVVSAFHQAMEDGDSVAALELLDPEVVIFESGSVEVSRDEYQSHHLRAPVQ